VGGRLGRGQGAFTGPEVPEAVRTVDLLKLLFWRFTTGVMPVLSLLMGCIHFL